MLSASYHSSIETEGCGRKSGTADHCCSYVSVNDYYYTVGVGSCVLIALSRRFCYNFVPIIAVSDSVVLNLEVLLKINNHQDAKSCMKNLQKLDRNLISEKLPFIEWVEFSKNRPHVSFCWVLFCRLFSFSPSRGNFILWKPLMISFFFIHFSCSAVGMFLHWERVRLSAVAPWGICIVFQSIHLALVSQNVC